MIIGWCTLCLRRLSDKPRLRLVNGEWVPAPPECKHCKSEQLTEA